MVGVAQMVRAPDCGSGGSEFDPHRLPWVLAVQHSIENNGSSI